jgi:hypothetical protein
MIARKAVFYGVGVALLASYFAAANMPSQDPEPVRERPVRGGIAPGELAVEVSSQAARLQSRMAQAPLPESNPRNPFSFGVVPRAPQPGTVRAMVAPETDAPPPPLAPVAPPPPVLTLMGIAEESSPDGPRRTAVIGGEGDHLFMVKEGDVLGGAYKVKKIGADAVELEDLVTKGYRRLALR